MADGNNPKKNKGEAHIRSMNIVQDEQGRLYDAAAYARRPEPRFSELNKYDEGLTPYHTYQQQEAIRAQNMTGWQARGNAVAQAIAEVGLGTAEGIGYLLDFEQHANLLAGEEQEFGNWFSDIMKSGKDWVGEEFPIYGGEGFQPLNGRWWSRNAASIASTLSLVIPAAGGVRALGKLGKFMKGKQALQALARISSNSAPEAAAFAKQMQTGLKGLSGALLSRYMENTMEATEVMQSEMQRLIAEGVPEDQARERAGEAASSAWWANNVALATDIPQYLLMFKLPSALKTIGADKGKYNKVKEILATMGSEAGEEAYQYGVQQAAPEVTAGGNFITRTAKVMAKMAEQAPEYIEDPEFWTSVTLGAVGGGVFATLGAAANERINRVQKAYRETQELIARGKPHLAEKRASEEMVEAAAEDPEGFKAMIDLAEDAEDPRKVAEAKKVLDDVESEKALRSEERLGEEKAKDAAKAKAAQRAADAAERDLEETTADTGTPVADPEAKPKDGILQAKKDEFNKLRKEYKNDENALKVIDKLEKEEETKSEQKGINIDLSTHAKAKEIRSKASEQARAAFDAAYKANKVNKADTPKGEQEYIKDKLAEKAKQEAEQVKNLIDGDPTPQQVVNLADKVGEDNKAKLRQKYKEEYERELERVTPPGEEVNSYEAWRDGVLSNSPYLAHNKGAAEPKLRKIWNEVKQQEQSAAKPGDRFRSAMGYTVQIEEQVNDNTLKVKVFDKNGNLLQEKNAVADDLNAAVESGELVPITSTTEPSSEAPAPQEDRNKPIVEDVDAEEADEYGVVATEKKTKQPRMLLMSNDIQIKRGIFQKDSNGYLEEDAWLAYQLGDNLAGVSETRRFRRKFTQLVGEDPEVRYVVDKTNPSNQTEDTDQNNFLIHAAVKYNGKWHSIGVLQAITDKRLKQLSKPVIENIKSIRAELWNKFQGEETVIVSDNPVKLNAVYSGHFNNKPTSETLQSLIQYAQGNPDESILPNGQLYLAIGTKDGELYGAEAVEDLPVWPITPKRGRVYMLVKNPNGFNYWARVYTVPVVEREKVKQAILDRLKIAEDAHREFIAFKDSIGKVPTSQMTKRINEELEKEDGGLLPTYKKWQQDWSSIRAAIQEDVRWRREKKDGNFEMEPDFNEKLPFVKKYWKDGSFSAQKFYDALAIDERPLQIDANKINSGDYNESIADRLKTDLDFTTAFHSPKFELAFYKAPKVEEAPTEEKKTTAPAPRRLKGKFKARKVDATSYPRMDTKKAIQWLKARLPEDVSVTVVDGLIRVGRTRAWGVTYNASIALSDVAAAGTEYHEAFHVVFDNILTDRERARIIKEAKKKYGDKDLNTLEENLAEDFREYVQGIETVGGRIKRFFQRLLEFIGIARSHKGEIEYLFERIERGEFKESPIISRRFQPKFRRYGVMSAPEVREAVSVVLNWMERAMDANGFKKMDYKKALSANPQENIITSTDYARFPQGTVMSELIGQYEDMKDNPNFNKAAMEDIIVGLRSDMKLVDGSFEPVGEPKKGDLYPQLLQGLAQRGWNIKLTAGEVIGTSNVEQGVETVEEYDETEEHREWWAIADISVSPKEQLSARLKRWLGNIPVPGEQDSLGLGYDKFYNGNDVYPLLQREIGNSYSFDDMMDRIMSSNIPLMQQIAAQLEGYVGDPGTMQLATELYTHIASKEHPEFKVVNVARDKDQKGDTKTSWRVFDSNVYTLTKIITNDFFDGFKKENVDKALGRVEEILDAKKNPEVVKRKRVPVDTFIKAMEYLGFTMPDQVAKSMNETNAYYAMRKLRTSLKQSDREFGDRFKKVVNDVKRFYPQDYQQTHFDVAGKKVYEWINSTFFGRMLNRANRNWQSFVDHYMADPLYKNLPILKQEQKFDFAITDGIKYGGRKVGIKYSDFSDKDMLLTQMAYYYNNSSKSKKGYFMLPILSDSPTLAAVKLPKNKNLSEEGGVFDQITEVVRFEWERMRRSEDTNTKNYSSGKDKVWLFKEFESELKSDTFDPIAVRQKVDTVVSRYQAGLLTRLQELELIKRVDGVYAPTDEFESGISNIPNFIREFAANHMLQHSQLILLSTGDPAFYKTKDAEQNLGDFYKRAKEIWSPGTYINKQNLFKDRNGNVHRVGQYSKTGKMRIKVLSDKIQQKASDFLDTITGIVGEKTATAYETIEVADGQTYIDLISWREREIGLGTWDDLKQASFEILAQGKSVKSEAVKNYNREVRNRIKESEGDEAAIANLERFLIPEVTSDQPYKPYVFTHRIVNNILTPTQKKDSEFIILPIYGVENYPLYNPEYKGYLEDMGYDFDAMQYKEDLAENRKYDVVTFESTIKVGNFASHDENSIIEIDYSDWRKQQDVPAHHRDTDEKFATQIMKLITADLEDGEYTLPDGTAVTKQQLIEEYSKLIIEDLKNSYQELQDRLTGDTPKETFDNLVEILREEVLNRGMGDQYMEALEQSPVQYLNTIQDTNLPLWHPLHSNRIESLLNAIFRKNVTNQKFSTGASFVNTSAYGFKRKPKLKFSSDGKRLLAVEAYIPIHAKELEAYTNEDGYIGEKEMEAIRKDINDGKLPNYLRGIVYRIPTEDKYSMFNIEVIGFLPSDAGSIIMPEEVTTIAGLDFDIDKVKGFFYSKPMEISKFALGSPVAREIKTKYNEKINDLKATRERSWKQFEGRINTLLSQAEVQKSQIDELREHYFALDYESIFLKDDLKRLKKERKEIADNRSLDLETTNLFDNLLGNDLELIDREIEQTEEYLQEVLSKRDDIRTAYNLIEDSGLVEKEVKEKTRRKYERQKELNDQIQILYAERDNAVEQAVKDSYETYTKKVKSDNKKIDLMRAVLESELGAKISLNPGNFENIKANNREITKITKPTPVTDFLDPSTLLDIARRMNAGKALIGFAANYNSAHALWMNHPDPISLKRAFVFEGKAFRNLGEHLDAIGKRVTENISEMLAAFVDNGKDPQADYFNMNSFTADTALSMLSTGVPLKTVQYFLSQPQIRAATKRYFDKGATRQAEQDIYNVAAEAYGKPITAKSEVDNLTLEDLEKGLKGDSTVQRKALKAFLVYRKRANTVADFVRATKVSDSGAGPTQPDNLSKIKTREEDFSDDIENAYQFLTADTFNKALYEQGIERTNKFIVENAEFPNLNTTHIKSIFDVIKERQGFLPSVKEVTMFYRDLMDYVASGFEFFENVEEVIESVPKQLREYQEKYPDNKFLNRLTVNKGIVEFRAVTGTDYSEEQDIREDWEDLLMQNEEFAKDLIRYTFARNGFKFGFNTFSHLQPVSFYATLQDSNGQYLNDYMAKRLKDIENGKGLSTFFKQYIDNNFEDLQHVPSVIWDVQGMENNVDKVLFKKNKIPYMIDTGMRDNFTYGAGEEVYPLPYIKLQVGNQNYLFKHYGDVDGIYVRVDTRSKRIKGKKAFQSYSFGDTSIRIFDVDMVNEYLNKNMDDITRSREKEVETPVSDKLDCQTEE